MTAAAVTAGRAVASPAAGAAAAGDVAGVGGAIASSATISVRTGDRSVASGTAVATIAAVPGRTVGRVA